MKWRAGQKLRLMRYISIPKLERLEGDLTDLGSTSLSAFGFGFSFSTNKSSGILSRVERVEKKLRRQNLLGDLDNPGSFQFILAEVPADEFVAQGVAVWIGELKNGYIVAGGSATYLDRNIDVFRSKGLSTGSNPSAYYAGLAALYRQALDSAGGKLRIPSRSLESWPATDEDGSYHAEKDPERPVGSGIWRIEPMDDVVVGDLYFWEIFKEAAFVHRWTGDPWRGAVRMLLLVHTDHTFDSETPDRYASQGDRLIIGSPLYVEQITPAGSRP